MDGGGDPERQQALEQYKKKLLESREWEAKLKALRMDIKGLQKDFETTEDNIKALQSVGQIIGEVLKQLDEERCKASSSSPSLFSTLDAKSYFQSSSKPPQALDTSSDVDQKSTKQS
jgi:ATP-dependent 26S proteasome regulatory subunit